MSNLNKRIFLFLMVVGLALGLVGCTKAENSVRIFFDEDEYSVRMAETKVINPTVIKSKDVGEVELVFSSSDESVVKYDRGVLIPVGIGEATIKVAWAGRDIIFDKAVVKVIKAALPKAIITYEDEMFKGAKQTVSVVLARNETEATYTITALNPEVATISETNEIEALAVGTAEFELSVKDAEDSSVEKFAVKVNESDFAITYDLDGGTNAEANPEGYSSLAEVVFAEPTKVGYTFAGWVNASDAKVEKLAVGTVGDVALKATWTPISYNVVVNGVEGATFTEGYTLPTAYTIESDEIVLGAPSKLGAAFLGYFDAEGVKVEKIAKGSIGDVTVTAKWETEVYNITYDLAGGQFAVTLDQIGEELFDDFYKWLGLTEGEATFFKGADGKVKSGGWYAQRAKLFAANLKGVGEAECFINDAVYNAKWIGFFNALDVCVTEVNAAQSFWGSAWTGNVRLYEIWDNAARYTDAQEAKLMAAAPALVVSTYTVDDAVTFAIPVKAGYTFAGWYKGEDKVDGIAKGSTGDVAVVAKWNIVEYTIALDANGGTIANYSTWASYKTKADVVADFLADYGTFAGKTYADANAMGTGNWSPTNYQTFYVATVNGVKMNVKWAWLVDYLIVNAGTADNKNALIKLRDGKPVTGDADPYSVSYELRGFMQNKQYRPGTGFATADYSQESLNNGFWSYIPTLPTKFTVLSVPTLPEVLMEHYYFMGWYEGETKVEALELKNYGTLTAKFEAVPQYTVSWDLAGGAFAEGVTAVTSFYKGEEASVVLNVPVKPYHQFEGWYEGETKVEAITAANHELVAKWTDLRITGPSYALIFLLEGGNWAEGQVPLVDVKDLDEILKLVPAKDGYEFVNWTIVVDETTDPDTVVYTANWKLGAYTISWNVNGGAFAEGVTPVTAFAAFEAVAMPAEPTRADYTFEGWYQGETKVEAIGNHSYQLVAKWKKIAEDFNIVWDLNGGAWVEGSEGPAKYTYGVGLATLPVPTKAEDTFVQWNDANGNKVTAIAVDAHEDVTLKAVWDSELIHQSDIDAEVEALATASAHAPNANSLKLSEISGAVTTWAYKDGEDTSVYDVATGARLKEMLNVCKRTLTVTVTYGDFVASKEVVVNFGVLEEGQTAFFYRGEACGMTKDEPKTNPKTGSLIGWAFEENRYTFTIGSQVLFIAGKNVRSFDSIDALKNAAALSWSSCLGLYIYTGAEGSVLLSELPAGTKNAVSGTYIVRDGKVVQLVAGGQDDTLNLKAGDMIFAAQYLDRFGISATNVHPLVNTSVDGEGVTQYADALAVGDAIEIKNWK